MRRTHPVRENQITDNLKIGCFVTPRDERDPVRNGWKIVLRVPNGIQTVPLKTACERRTHSPRENQGLLLCVCCLRASDDDWDTQQVRSCLTAVSKKSLRELQAKCLHSQLKFNNQSNVRTKPMHCQKKRTKQTNA